MLAGSGSEWCDDTTANPFLTSTVLRMKKYVVTMKAVNINETTKVKIIPEWWCARGGKGAEGGIEIVRQTYNYNVNIRRDTHHNYRVVCTHPVKSNQCLLPLSPNT